MKHDDIRKKQIQPKGQPVLGVLETETKPEEKKPEVKVK